MLVQVMQDALGGEIGGGAQRNKGVLSFCSNKFGPFKAISETDGVCLFYQVLSSY